jgi:hypothetical protein
MWLTSVNFIYCICYKFRSFLQNVCCAVTFLVRSLGVGTASVPN